jgi:hypothetical protein
MQTAEVDMNRDPRHGSSSGGFGRIVVALAIAAVCGSIGVPAGLTSLETDVTSAPSWRPMYGSSVFPDPRAPSAAPDHAMLSAADVERALPAPSRTTALTEADRT